MKAAKHWRTTLAHAIGAANTNKQTAADHGLSTSFRGNQRESFTQTFIVTDRTAENASCVKAYTMATYLDSLHMAQGSAHGGHTVQIHRHRQQLHQGNATMRQAVVLARHSSATISCGSRFQMVEPSHKQPLSAYVQRLWIEAMPP